MIRKTAPKPLRAFLQDGAFVYVSRNAALEQPLHVVHVATPAADPIVSQPRTLIVLDEGASAVVVESFVAAGDGVYLTNAVTEAAVGANAQLDYVKLQRESEQAFHIASLHVRQERASRFRSHSISLGAELSRNDIFAVLAAEGAECLLNGLFLTGGRQHVDNQTTIDHAKPHGTSRELYKGILGGRSRGVFNGKIIVRPDAQKTDARQSNRNLLLSDRAEIDTKPNLEIHADDVRCTHGSTIGHLDEDALFYLQSRGIPERASRRLLTRAFAAEIVDTLPTAPVREGVHELVDARLERGAIAEAA